MIAYHGSKDDHYDILAAVPDTIPVVTTGYAFDQSNVVAVRVDSRKGARDAVRHLVALGHESIAMITGAPRAYETEERILGYRDAMNEAGLSVDSSLLVEGDWFVESGFLAANRLLEDSGPFSAVFAHSDRMAMGCIAALTEHGRRVPEDVAVVGYNDIPESRYYNPPLTTVRYPSFELGQICAKLLIDLIDGKDPLAADRIQDESDALNTQLVVRRSCGAYLRQQ
jgi:LacI family transcriptional regulator